MSIERALKKTSLLLQSVGKGKQGMESADRACIIEGRKKVVDSLNLDLATKAKHSSEPRWDYILGITNTDAEVIAVEVHPAKGSEARAIVAKKNAAEAVLKEELQSSQRVRRWFWVASGKTKLTETMPEAKLLNLNKIRLVGSVLKLDDQA